MIVKIFNLLSEKRSKFSFVYLVVASVFTAAAEFDVSNSSVFIFAKSNPPSAVTGSSTCHRQNWKWILRPDVARDEHDVKELLVSPAIDEDVDGRVDDLEDVRYFDISYKCFWSTRYFFSFSKFCCIINEKNVLPQAIYEVLQRQWAAKSGYIF